MRVLKLPDAAPRRLGAEIKLRLGTCDYATEQDAAKGLLLEVASVLNRHVLDYAVIGGWVPFLFNSHPIPHPGTMDVDVLMSDVMRKDLVVTALDSLRGVGYQRSAKNEFQLYRSIQVAGEPILFHVDFLHRKHANDTVGLFKEWGPYKSIQGPGTDVIFIERELRVEQIQGTLPNKEQATIRIPFATEAGFLSTKGRSVGFGKRDRDAFDIFLVLRQSQNYDGLISRCNDLLMNDTFSASMRRLCEEMTKETVIEKASKFLHSIELDEEPISIIRAEVSRFTAHLSL